jgi:HEAT repeat protein
VIIEIWKATLPLADERQKKHRSMSSWSSWRQGAAEALGALGSKDDIAFLEEQAKATRDSYVADACRAAIKAIDKRTKTAQATAGAPSAPTAANAKPAPTAPTAPGVKPAPDTPTAPAGPTPSPR